MGQLIAERIPVIDTDSHLIEPPDLWTARLPSKWADSMPRIERDADRGEDFWLIGDRRISPAWQFAMAGWKEFLPSHPKVQDDVDPAGYDPKIRAERLDEYGISAQVLYPNILGFFLQSLLTVEGPDFHLACVEAYNDFLADFADAAPGRFIPVMAIPFWDLEASIAEVERAAARGHRGILFANRPEVLGVPPMRDKHWDPLWAVAQDAGLSINFHVGFGQFAPPEKGRNMFDHMGEEERAQRTADARANARADFVKSTVLGLMSNSNAIVELLLCGLLDRFPRLNFVSVESGFGYLPYLIETTNWQWLNTGAVKAYPDRLLPSEYFRRQVYGTFWFEQESLTRLIDLYPDNVMFESDFPHPTSLSPGPASYTEAPNLVIEKNLGGLPEETLRKILHDNAARVYGLD